MTLPAATIHQVRYMLRQRLPHREIARQLNYAVSRGTITKIAQGRYHPHATAEPENQPERPPPTIEKCNGCHYLVEMPCRICRARALRRAMRQHEAAYRRQHQ